MARKPEVKDVLRQNGGVGPAYGETGKVLPQLSSWLCDLCYEDGSPKGRVKVTLERKGDRMLIKITSADSGQMVEHLADNLSDAVLGLDLLLGSDDCPWQEDPYPLDKPKEKKRRKS